MSITDAGENAQFGRRLQEECAYYSEKYNYDISNLGRGFEGWLAHFFAQEAGFREILEHNDTKQADLGHVIIRQNDLGIDIVLDDAEDKQLLLVQAKWTSKRSYVSIDTIESFFGIYHRLMDPEFIATGGPQIQELLGDFGDKVADGYTVRLRFVTNRPLPDNTRRSKSIASIQKAYEADEHDVICELFGQTELKELEQQLESAEAGILDKIEFPVANNDAIEFTTPLHSMICRISGNALTNMYNEHKQSLFAFNIRLPMGLQRAINAEIRQTATDDAENFFFFNNGVSAVCSEFKYDDEKNEVVAERFQIINGAQTVGAIAGAPNSPDLTVLFRLTETNEATGGTFTENIVRYNNTQNPVEVADFRANDNVQQFLVDALGEISGKGVIPRFVYVPKRGSRRGGRGGRSLPSKELAALRHSMLNGPVPSYRDPKSLFDPSPKGLYWQAFGSRGSKRSDRWDGGEIAEIGLAIALDVRIKAIAKGPPRVRSRVQLGVMV